MLGCNGMNVVRVESITRLEDHSELCCHSNLECCGGRAASLSLSLTRVLPADLRPVQQQLESYGSVRCLGL